MKQNKSKKGYPNFIRLGAIVLLALLNYGCNPNHLTGIIPNETKQGTTSTLRPVRVKEATKTFPASTPMDTPTSNPSPTVTNSATPKPTQTPLWIPAPTLSYYQTDITLNRLFKGSEDCKLPCWFEITPGVTSWWDARNFLQPFSQIQDWHDTTHYISFDLYTKNGGFRLEELDGIVDHMFIGRETTKRANITLPRILKEYGKPDKVFVQSTVHVPETYYPFYVVLYYQDQNILANFEFNGQIHGEKICAYPQSDPPQLWVWSDEGQLELPKSEFPKWILGIGKELPPIEQATDLDMEMFFQTFKDSRYAGTICTPVDE